MEERFITLSEIFKDSAMAQKLMACSPEEAACLLKEQYNLTFTVEELNDVAAGIRDALNDDSNELSDDQLEDITGGGKGSGAYNAGYYTGKVVKVVGVAASIGKLAIAVGVISW